MAARQPSSPLRFKPRNGRFFAVIGLLTVLLASPSGGSFARQPPPIEDLLELPFDALLQVQIDSAGKRGEALRDIPASVTIVTREEIASYGWITFEQVLRNVPGFFILSNIEDRFIGTRGIVGGGLQFLVNGISQHPSRQRGLTVPEIARLNIPVESIDRLEIIRGPMSVIYGNNAFLGLVNVVTNDLAAAGSMASVSLGTRGTGKLFGRYAKGSADGFLVLNAGGWGDDGLAGAYADMMSPEQLAGLDPAMHRDMDGDMDQREGSLELSAGWRGLSADLRWTRRDYGIYALTPAFDDGTRVQLDRLQASLGLAHRFSDRLGLRLTGIHSQEAYVADPMDFLFADAQGRQHQESQRWELELDLHWQPSERLSTLLGYRLLHLDGLRNRADSPPVIDVLVRTDPITTHDLFAETGWQLTERLRLTAGGRVSLLPKRYRSTLTNVGDVATVGNETTSVITAYPDDSNPLTGRISLLFAPHPSQVIKLIWGSATQDAGDADIADPERIETLELNSTLTGTRWLLSTSLFQNDIRQIARSLQILDPQTGDYASIDDNSGHWRTRGLELILEGRPLPALNLSASLTWQQTEDRSSGIDPGYSPALLAKLKADWQQGPMTYAAYAEYVDAMDADWDFITSPQQGMIERIGERVPGDWNLGLNLRWDPAGPGPFAALNATNLLDSDNRDPANELTDLERGLIGPGRTLTLTLGYAF
ncbi:MAG: hypothetical protein C1943_09640 [Halochromatium sp.]|nr:hypothetical protein [Halochromatium sp.]